ncbi:MAG: c-type cytochrome domain-containing protein [Verrucomicrobiales bacterium]
MPPTFRFFTSLDTSATFLRGWLLLTGLLLWMDTAKVSAEDAKTYLDEVKPLLRERCYSCHGALKQKGRLRLDTAQRILAAEVIANGELLARVTSQDPEKRMPHEGAPLKPAQIAILRRWIDAGTRPRRMKRKRPIPSPTGHFSASNGLPSRPVHSATPWTLSSEPNSPDIPSRSSLKLSGVF